jgi:hypothetical protein
MHSLAFAKNTAAARYSEYPEFPFEPKLAFQVDLTMHRLSHRLEGYDS